MSPRAAWRLESLGFADVYDYAAGKADWLAWGLPREGRMAQVPTVGEVAKRDVPTCGLADRVADAKARAQATGFAACVVVNERRVVLGLLRSRELDADPAATAEQVMLAGPTTYRSDNPAREAGARMRERGVDVLPATTPDGVLVGLLRREDAEGAKGIGTEDTAGATGEGQG